jgi:elongation factor G
VAYNTEQIRNIALSGHSGAGKTLLAEAVLFNLGLTNRLGRIEDGTTVLDYDKEEIERQYSVRVSLLNGDWKSHRLNILDTPGYADFIAEAKGALRIADATVVILDAVTGVEIGTERVWNFAADFKLPRLLFINKMDRSDIVLEQVLEMCRERFGRQVVQLQLPVNLGEGFHQIVDLVEMKLRTYKDGKAEAGEIPPDFQDAAQELHEQLVEAVAETDEELMEKYFGAGELSPEELKAGLGKAIAQLELFPVYFGDAYNNVGVDKLLDAMVDYLPNPQNASGLNFQNEEGREVQLEGKSDAPLAALVFKTLAEQHVGELTLLRLYAGSLKSGDEVSNPAQRATERIGQTFRLNGHQRTEVSDEVQAGDIVALVKLRGTHTGNTLCAKGESLVLPGIEFPEPLIRVGVGPKETGGEDRMATGLAQLHEEDPSFVFTYDPGIKQSLLLAQGDVHLDSIIHRLRDRFGVEIDTEAPRIPYRETIRRNAEGHYRHKKQTGGRGQFGEVFLRINAKERGEGFEFASVVVGGNIPSNFIPAVKKGIVESLEEGPLSGCKVVDVAATVYDGKHHAVDSDEVSFKLAGSHAFKEAFLKARPVLLEPIYSLTVTVPEEYMGDVMGDISSRRGRISGMDTDGHLQIIQAEVPLAEIDRYATSLRSMSHGKGLHTQKFERYEEVPNDIMERIVADSKREKEAA